MKAKTEIKNETILIVEDEKQIRNYISHILAKEGFQNKTAENAGTALSMLASGGFDIVLLDLGLPDIDGIEVIKKIREWSEIPIIIISARDQDKEKAAALDGGADDYLTKPFSETELLARIRVALRHAKKTDTGKVESVIKTGDLKIDFEKRLVYLRDNDESLTALDKEVHLTPIEYSLLSLFFKNIGKVLTSKYIMKEVWGITYERNTETLRAHMAGLRRKIEKNPSNPRYLLTEIGVGYRLAVE